MSLVEEIVNDGQRVGSGNLVVDKLADGQVQHPKPEGREHHGPICWHSYPAVDHIAERAVQEVAIPGELLCQVSRGIGLQ